MKNANRHLRGAPANTANTTQSTLLTGLARAGRTTA